MKATFQATTSSKLNLPSLSLCTTETLLNKLSGFQRFPSAAELSARYSREDLRILAYRHGFAGVIGAHEPKPAFASAVEKLFSNGRLSVPNPSLSTNSLLEGLSKSELEHVGAPVLSWGNCDVDLSDSEELEEVEKGELVQDTCSKMEPKPNRRAIKGPRVGYIVEEVPEEEEFADILVSRVLKLVPSSTRILIESLPYLARRIQAAEIASKNGGIDSMELAATNPKVASKLVKEADSSAKNAPSSKFAPSTTPKKTKDTLKNGMQSVGVQWSPQGEKID